MFIRNGVFVISTANMTREEWLEERKKSIGGSDAAAIIGMNKFASPYSLWADKTGRVPPKEDNEAMRLGRDLEEYVAKRFCEETGKSVRRLNGMIRNRKYPWAHADVDRVVEHEQAILECKTTSALNLKRFKDIDFPEQYYCQCVHYMAVTGADKCYLAVLILGKEFRVFELDRDECEIAALMDAEAEFWKLVETDTPPAPDGAEATSESLTTIYDRSDGREIELFGREGLLKDLVRMRRERKALDGYISEIENTIKSDLQSAERGWAGSYKVSWKNQDRRIFQAKEFEKAHPEIDLTPFFKISSNRVFKVSEEV